MCNLLYITLNCYQERFLRCISTVWIIYHFSISYIFWIRTVFNLLFFCFAHFFSKIIEPIYHSNDFFILSNYFELRSISIIQPFFSSSRGFLKSDKGIGQANIKLTNFSSKCEIHECVDVSVSSIITIISSFCFISFSFLQFFIKNFFLPSKIIPFVFRLFVSHIENK